MFSRSACYFFVRPKRSTLEICLFLGRTLKCPQVRRIERVSKSKLAHIIHITHRDEVEAPITDWLREAYESSDVLSKPPQSGVNRRNGEEKLKNTGIRTSGRTKSSANKRRRA